MNGLNVTYRGMYAQTDKTSRIYVSGNVFREVNGSAIKEHLKAKGFKYQPEGKEWIKSGADYSEAKELAALFGLTTVHEGDSGLGPGFKTAMFSDDASTIEASKKIKDLLEGGSA